MYAYLTLSNVVSFITENKDPVLKTFIDITDISPQPEPGWKYTNGTFYAPDFKNEKTTIIKLLERANNDFTKANVDNELMSQFTKAFNLVKQANTMIEMRESLSMIPKINVESTRTMTINSVSQLNTTTI